MGRIITICNTRDLNIDHSKISNNSSMRVGPVSIKFITIAIVCLLSLFYLAQSQKTSIRAYQIQELQNDKEKIMSENEELQVNTAKLKSIENIQSEIGALQMVPSTQANYLGSQNNIN